MTKKLTEQWREGDRFGKLTVLGFHHKDKHYHRYYEDGTLGGSVARQAMKEMEGVK